MLQQDAKEARKRALGKLKKLERDIDTYSKTIDSLHLLKGVKPLQTADKAISDITILLNEAKFRKYSLETIIAKADNAPPPEVSDSIRSRRSSVSSGPYAAQDNLPPFAQDSLSKKNFFTSPVSPAIRDNLSEDFFSSPIVPSHDSPSKKSLFTSPVSPAIRDNIFSTPVPPPPQENLANTDSLIKEHRYSKRVSSLLSEYGSIPAGKNTDSLMTAASENSRSFARVIYAFKGDENTQEISVEEGEVIEIVEKSDDGYV
jgi:hypothetical protein